MTTTRTTYVIALVAAVLVLLASVGAVLAVAASDSGPFDGKAQSRFGRYDSEAGPRAGSMMGGDAGNRAWSADGDRGEMPRMTADRRCGGMAGWADAETYGWDGTGAVTVTQARVEAQRWVDRFAEGAELGDAVSMPMGYRFLALDGGTVVAMIMVDEDSGSVFGRLWATAPQR
jgi:hypothetical protein